ncbi:MAG: dUTP diphosphatase [Ferruginibacter sp.]|nr:dUTP diphosphatase [Ferruginibacter sp.]
MEKIKIPIVNCSQNDLPSYATAGAAGMDIRAALNATIVLKPFERKLIETGLFIELPDNYEAQIRPRSGLAVKQGLTCLNSPGTIDSDYRGEIKVLLINLSNEDQEIYNGDRIAQMVISKIDKAELILVQQLNITERGSGGFGHTGKQ